MSTVYDSVVRKLVKHLAETLFDMIIVAAGEIATSYTSIKQSITTENHAVFFIVKTDMTGSMTRSEQHLQIIVANLYNIAIVELDGRIQKSVLPP